MTIVRKRLRQAREDAGLSQEEVAKQLKLGSHVAYGNYERGKADPDLDNLMKLSRILSKPVTWFLGIENGGELSPDEVELLNCYRQLSFRARRDVLAIAQDFARREASEA